MSWISVDTSETLAPTAPVPFAGALEDFGDRTALITADGIITYRDLCQRADRLGERLGPVRRLVLLAAANDVDTVVGYLAALRHGHPVLLVPRQCEAIEAMALAYSPDVILDGARVTECHPASAHALHPELALLLSTSGSTGSPKLVRLSRTNVQSNAESIGEYLGIRPDDRAASTLPLHYCYGLSVLNSHLARGAALILTRLSVADDEFWELFRRERGTTFAGVPYTFDLLDRAGFADQDLPSLRYVTQAGGRLDPDRVRRYAHLGESRGWDLVVMYGQTEATARMAYLPPNLAATAPDAIGIPIPGGSLRIEAEESGVGELVYRGDNVMLGYAEHPADLGLGQSSDELFTGDLAHRGADGLYRIVGRRNRFLKIYGHRVDLQRVESVLAGRGVSACCGGDDHTLVVAIEVRSGSTGVDVDAVRRHVIDATGLPGTAIRVRACPRIPRLVSGKPDYPAIAAMAVDDPAPVRSDGDDRAGRIVRTYAATLERSDITPADSFVDLGGDSLSYVEASIRLEQILGTLPPNWHVTPIAELAATGPATQASDEPRRRLRMLDTSVLLRAIAIVLVVGTHVQLFGIPGGAHMLLGVAGYNFARFQLTGAARADRARGIARSLGRIVVASVVWIALVMLASDQYTWANIFLVNNVVGTIEHLNTWHFWYIEDLVYFVVAATALLSFGVVDRWERRWPFALPMVLMALGLIARYQLVPGVELHKTAATAWLFTIGWAGAKATSNGQRAVLTVATLATIPGVFGDPGREVVMIAGLLLLIWVPAVRVTRLVAVVAGTLASASLYIYLVHWQVYMHIWGFSKVLAFVASLAAGLVYAAMFRRVSGYVAAFGRRMSRARSVPNSTPASAAAEGALN